MSGTLPTTPTIRSYRLRSIQPVYVDQSQSNRRHSRKTSAHVWRIDATYAMLYGSELWPLIAFFLKQNGQADTFQLSLPDKITPSGHWSGVPLVNGASQSGNTLVIDNAWDRQYPELHTNANAASIENEFHGYGSFLPVGCVLVSQSTIKHHGTYALYGQANTTPTAGARFYIDIETQFGLVNGDVCNINFYWRHAGSGGDWVAGLGPDTSTTSYDIDQTTSAETSFTYHEYNFVFDANHKYLIIREENGTNDGGVYFDSLSCKKSGNLIENNKLIYDQAWGKGTGITISAGLASWDGTQVSWSYLTQDLAGLLSAGVSCILTYTLTLSAGSFNIWVGNANPGTIRTDVGTNTYIEKFESLQAGVDFILWFGGDSSFIGSISNFTLYISDYAKAGDLLTIAGDSKVYILTEDSGISGDGNVTLTFIPELQTTPADNAAVTSSNVQFTVALDNTEIDYNVEPGLLYEHFPVNFIEHLP